MRNTFQPYRSFIDKFIPQADDSVSLAVQQLDLADLNQLLSIIIIENLLVDCSVFQRVILPLSFDRIVGGIKREIESAFAVGLLVEDLTIVEGFLKDQIALRCIVSMSKDELHCKIVVDYFGVEMRMLSLFLKGTDLKIYAVKGFLDLFGPANHIAKLILVISNQASVSFGTVCCSEGHIQHVDPLGRLNILAARKQAMSHIQYKYSLVIKKIRQKYLSKEFCSSILAFY